MKKLVVLCIVAAACAFGTRGARTISSNSINLKPGSVMPADVVEGFPPVKTVVR